ncbi:MAG: acyl-CoA dehydrogenase family protein [Devosia sp.]
MDQFGDIVFTLGAVGALGAAEPWDAGAIESVLAAYKGFIDTEVAPTNAPADRVGCHVLDGRVHLPPALPQLYKSYVALGWQLLPLSVDVGGIGAPVPVCCAASEMLSGANHAFEMLVALVPGAIGVIDRFGTEAQKAALIPDLVAGTALATMCLTEADAGSDLGVIRTSAAPDGFGCWSVSGEKIFISGGDQDLSQTIVHLVLARTGPLADGVKGLSLFACPSLRADGTRNGVSVVRIEEKLGLHASPTCQLRFDAAQAHLLGQPGDGLKAMFVMMDHARLDVAIQGVAHAAQAHTLAVTYAGQRRQGDRAIAEHGDVARMLAEMEALTLGSRAMAYRAAALLEHDDLAAFLTPVCKVFCTDTASTVADLGIQVLGGYGYLPEYGMEQIWRDARVTRLYEGTNGVLAMSLVRRLLGGPGEAAFVAEVDAALALAPSAAARDGLAAIQQDWRTAADTVLASHDKGRAATSLMALTGLLYFAACWVRLEAADPGGEQGERIRRLGRFVRAALLPDAVALRIRCQALAHADTEDA